MNITDNSHISQNDTNSNTNINYQKRKNTELFKALEKPETLFLSKTQNYIPIYDRFFSLNESNYNSINLNHKWYLYNIKNNIDANSETKKIFQCRIKNIENDEIKTKNIFIKLAPLLDPFKYLVGKYSNIIDDKLYNLPNLDATANNKNCHNKLLDTNNSAYVDGLFVYISSLLKNNYNFNHGLDYYGSFLSIKNNYMLNVFDDLDYLNSSDFFNKNKNILFKIDEYEHLIKSEKHKLKTIKIDYTSSAKSTLSLKSINNELFENLFNDNDNNNDNNCEKSLVNNINNTIIECDFNTDIDIDLNNDLDNQSNSDISKLNTTLKSNASSSCSSRLSYTNSETSEKSEMNNDEFDNECEHNSEYTSYKSESDCVDIDTECQEYDDEDGYDDTDKDYDTDDEDDEDDVEEEEINVTISKFPVQLICMENCENTLDDLILNDKLTNDEWFSALMQIIMVLITYQKVFSFTHNDLHTNNIMYNETSKKFIIYHYNKKTYKVPTFGKIFKIIDFGRSIYKFQGKLFCSDSFQNGNDAASQYNTEPYFDEKKPRLEPNPSFDLSRLACSIFDYLIEDLEESKDVTKIIDPVKKLIVEWCLDDNGINLLYKNNGDERYPDFKLYKMIARHVHNHTPQVQLERPEFKQFLIENNRSSHNDAYTDKKQNTIKIDIDKIPSLV